ncbi:unnamed protein product, partial [Iphiclides podalirius]
MARTQGLVVLGSVIPRPPVLRNGSRAPRPARRNYRGCIRHTGRDTSRRHVAYRAWRTCRERVVRGWKHPDVIAHIVACDWPVMNRAARYVIPDL